MKLARVSVFLLVVACGHQTEPDPAAVRRRSALEIVVRAQGAQRAMPAARTTPYCASSTSTPPAGCDETPDQRAKRRLTVAQRLQAFDHAFFVACRAQGDGLATMITTEANATDLMASYLATQLAGSDDDDGADSDLVRAQLRDGFMKTLADALDDQVSQHTEMVVEHLDTISDKGLRWIEAEADPGHAAELVRRGLFYIGKQSPAGE